MAKTKSIDLNALERRANAALARLAWWDTQDLPASYQRPQVYRMLIEGLAGELPRSVASSKAFLSAMAAVGAWSAAQHLAEEAAQLYHDPAIRQLAGSEQNLRWLLENPEAAQKLLIEHSVAHPAAYRDRAGPLSRALAGLAEYATFHETHGDTESVSADAAPGTAPQREQQPKPAPDSEERASAAVTRPAAAKPAMASFDELLAKPHLSKQEYQQLLEWVEEDQAIEAAIDSGAGQAEWPESRENVNE